MHSKGKTYVRELLSDDVEFLGALPPCGIAIGGTDVVTAVALGADAAMIGRPYRYGLATAGPVGVEAVPTILAGETRTAPTLMGVASIRDVDGSHVAAPD